jgi:hypothetical protein
MATPTVSVPQFSGIFASASIPNAALANPSLTVTAGTGLSGGGSVALGASITLSLPNVGPGTGTIGSAGIASITLDAQGRVTAATTATYLTSAFYQTAQNGGVSVTQRPTINFTSGLQAVDNAGNTRTDVSIATAGVTNAMLANSSVTVTAGAGLATTSASIALGASATLSVGGTADATYSTGAFTWAGASGKAMSLVATAAAITITAASASTWDSADGALKAASLDRSTAGVLSIGSGTATSVGIGGSGLSGGMTLGLGTGTNLNLQWAGSTAIAIQSNGALFQFVKGGTRTINIGTEAVDTAGNALALTAGGGGAASVTGGGAGGQMNALAGTGGTATTSLAAGTGGQGTYGGGTGGTGAASGQNPGAGGLAIFRGGTGGTVTGGFGGGNGGNAAIRGGLATGTGTNGNVLIGDANTVAVTISGFTGALTMTAGTTSTWDSKDGTVKAATFDRSTAGTLTLGGTATTVQLAAGASLSGAAGAGGLSLGSMTGDTTLPTGAVTWSGASGKNLALTSTGTGTISITAAAASTWDSKDGTVKAASLDRSTAGALTIAGGTATSLTIGSTALTTGPIFNTGTGTTYTWQINSSSLLTLNISGSGILQFAGAQNAVVNVGTSATDVAGKNFTINSGNAGAASASNGQAAGTLSGQAGTGAAATAARTAGAGGVSQWVGGTGGAGNSSNAGGAGGQTTTVGGTGGAGTATALSGAGGLLLLSGGSAGTSGGAGQGAAGGVSIRGGAGSTFGTVAIGDANTATVAIGTTSTITTILGNSTSSLDLSLGSGIFSTTTGANTLNGNVTIAVNKTLTGSLSAVGTAQTVHTSIQNTTAAANGAQQYSPVFELSGQGWNPTAGASRTAKWGFQSQPIQATGDPANGLSIFSSVNGTAYAEKFFLEDLFSSTVLRIGGASGITFNSGTANSFGNQQAATQTLYPDRDVIQGYSLGYPTLRWYDIFSLRSTHGQVGIGDVAPSAWGSLYISTSGYQTVNTNTPYGLYQLGGNARFAALSNVGTVTVTPTGGVATGATYAVVAVDRNGYTTLAGTGNTASGPSTFDATHFNTASWTAIPGAVYYDVYAGTVSQANWLGSTTSTSFKDTIGSGASNGRYTSPGAGAVYSVVGASIAATGGTGTANTYFIYTADGDGHLSAATTKASAPTPTTGNPVTITWSPVGGAAYYVIAEGTNTNIIGTTALQPYSNGTTNVAVTVPNGGLVRTGGTTVTATIANGHQLRVGDSFTLTSADANFASGTYTVATVTSATVFTYASAGSNVTSTNVAITYTGPTGIPGATFVDYAYPGRTVGSAARNITADVTMDGALTTGDIINNGVSASAFIDIAGAGTTFTTTPTTVASGTYVAPTTRTYEITVYIAGANNSAANYTQSWRLLIDGATAVSNQASKSVQNDTNRHNVSFAFRTSLTAGSHTIALQGSVNTGTTTVDSTAGITVFIR